MLKLLHISDLHFGPPYVPEVGAALLRVVPELEPEVIVASGDFTQRAKRQQFAEARQFLDDLSDAPIVCVPGNHDVPLYRVVERWTRPHELYQEFISEDLDSVTHVPGAVFVALDSTAPRRTITNGRITQEQLDFCARAFRDVPDDVLRVVVAHHHFAPAPDYERDQTMPRAQRALDLFVELGVDLVLGGHLHRGYIGNSLDVYSGANRERGLIIIQCGTTTSRRGRAREREKNSFNLLTVDDDMVHVTHYMYFSEEETFGPVSRHAFPRPGKRFVERPREEWEEVR